MTVQKMSDPPELIALCRKDENGEEKVAGWAMVLPNKVVGYIPDPTCPGAVPYAFASLDSAERYLSYTDIYPVRHRATVPDALDRTVYGR